MNIRALKISGCAYYNLGSLAPLAQLIWKISLFDIRLLGGLSERSCMLGSCIVDADFLETLGRQGLDALQICF